MGKPLTNEDIQFIEELDLDLLKKNYKSIISFIVGTGSFYIISRNF